MKTKDTPDLTNISLTFPPDLLASIDERARALDMNRSQYLRHLARNDLAEVKKKTRRLVPAAA